MMEWLAGGATAISMALAGWLVQLSNKVSQHETAVSHLRDLINSRFDQLEQRLERVESLLMSTRSLR